MDREMIGIFVDNYRGFTQQIIPLKDVNFLVGENSTGKTSFLSIVKLMSDPSFWLDSDFNDDTIRLGSFSELISAGSDNKKSFSIGFYISEKKEEEEIISNFRLVTFKNEEGLPIVSKYSFLFENELVATIIRKDSMLYKKHSIQMKNESFDRAMNLCFEEHCSSSTKGYKSIEAKGFPRELFFAHADRLVSAAFKGDNFFEGKKSFNLFLKSDLPRVSWIAPIRAKPKITYEGYKTDRTADGEHIPQLLNKYISKSKMTGKQSKFIEAINNFGVVSGLFEKIDTKRFGKDLNSPFEMNVVINNKILKMCNVGYGISQVLPVITEILARRRDSPIFLIQQPEVHLHPKAQAALGELIFNAAQEEDNNNNNKFIIETHSDYLIDRFRLCQNKSESEFKKTKSQVLFFEREGIFNKAHCIEIGNDGSYPHEQPSGFREFFLNEEIDLLRI
jgi:predicted ATPase